MSSFLLSVGTFFAVIIVLVLVHELGHYLTAKMFGVKVLEFGFGYPPRIWGFKRGETEWTFNILPLGGFVRLLGEEDPSDPRSLAAQARWKRIVVLAAGSFMNLIFPFVLFAVAFMIPHEVAVGRPVIQAVVPDSPAAEAGLQPGDVVYSIAGRETNNLQDLYAAIRLNFGRDVPITVRRGSQAQTQPGSAGDAGLVTTTVHVRWTHPSDQGPTGIQISPQYPFTDTVSEPIWVAVPHGIRQTFDALLLTRNEIMYRIRNSQGVPLSGPVGIAQVTGEAVETAGWQSLFELGAILSINLAILNILPLPMLDGGRIFFVVVEIIRGGRRIAPSKEGFVHLVGFVLLISFVVIISYFDILRVIRGESLLR
jgi:regulator of sigma E protease